MDGLVRKAGPLADWPEPGLDQYCKRGVQGRARLRMIRRLGFPGTTRSLPLCASGFVIDEHFANMLVSDLEYTGDLRPLVAG